MALVLASINSRKSNSAALMLYDLERGCARYVQMVDFSGIPALTLQIRGISLAGERLYAIGTCALFIFRISTKFSGPLFVLEKNICRPEWVIGGKEQGDLHAVFADRQRQQVYVSFNAQSAIDSFDLEGNFLKRLHLWDIAPDLFPLPSKVTAKNFYFGVIRHIFENHRKEIMLTAALINNSQDSAVINYNTGKSVLTLKDRPLHGGLLHRQSLYLCAIRDGEVLSFTWPADQEEPEIESMRRYISKITDKKYKNSDQKTRGLIYSQDHLISGICYFGKPKPKQIPPRMVEFDLNSRKQTREYWLPTFQDLEEPHIHGLLTLDPEIEQGINLPDEPVFYQGEKRIAPVRLYSDGYSSEAKKDIQIDGSKEPGENGVAKADPLLVPPPTSLQNHRISETDDQRPAIDATVKAEIKLESLEEILRPTVVLEHVSIYYERAARKFLSFNKNLRNKKSFWALRDLSFTVNEGETLGVIGRNGSGKSTLSMICGGVLIPDMGKVTIKGKAQLLALSVGFKNELSGRENVFISGSLMGLSKKEITACMAEIESFAELGEFIDEPVRTYSSGMRSRLGFAVATAVQPDILILDEIMATGDKAFQDKAMRRMREMRGLARSVIVVSHNPSQLRKLSTRVLWLEKGRMVMLGEPKEVLNAYDNFCQNPEKWLQNNPDTALAIAAEKI